MGVGLRGKATDPGEAHDVGHETSDQKPMRLLDTQTLEGGIAYLTYQSVRDA